MRQPSLLLASGLSALLLRVAAAPLFPPCCECLWLCVLFTASHFISVLHYALHSPHHFSLLLTLACASTLFYSALLFLTHSFLICLRQLGQLGQRHSCTVSTFAPQPVYHSVLQPLQCPACTRWVPALFLVLSSVIFH